MDSGLTHPELEPIAGTAERSVEVLSTTVRIHDLSMDRPTVAAYLERISPEKQELAVVHALEVGVTELLARRERFKK